MLKRCVMALAIAVTALPAAAATCTRDDFGRAVDDAGASLREFNAKAMPQLQGRLRALQAKKGWNDGDYEGLARERIADETTARLDTQVNELLDQIDQLGRVPDGAKPDCAKLDQIQASSVELLAVMKAKSAHMLARIDAEIGGAPTTTAALEPAPGAPVAAPPAPAPAASPATPTAAAPAAPAGTATGGPPASPATGEEKPFWAQPAPPPPAAEAPSNGPAPSLPSVVAPAKPAAAPVKPASPAPKAAEAPRPAPPPPAKWSTTTSAAPPPPSAGGRVADLANGPPPPAPEPPVAPVPPAAEVPDSYTADEIREATRGFFGTISTSLASVLEHAFSTLGRPTGYVLGEEGGGAFLAGVRYGHGTLYLHRGQQQKVYWHGPSVGYDVGAAGSRTMFLIYNLHETDDLFRTYAGLDGSAYVVGGFGVTVLQGGYITMAPIRSGLGLRVGANIGYVRFTREQGWNPF
jgi:hypothetical protein